MEILSFEGSNGSSKPKRGGKFVVVATIAALGFMGSTFAASVTLNNGADIQYGQGVAQATACDNAITITPANSFVNTSGSGAFYLQSVSLVDTRTASSSTGLANCVGKTIKISVFGDSSSSALASCDVAIAAYSASGTADSAAYTHGITSTSTCSSTANVYAVTNGLKLKYTTPASAPNVAASGIYKITLESF